MGEIYLFRQEEDSGSDVETIVKDKVEEREEKIFVCKSCGFHITSVDLAIEVNDGHHHTFFNPAGIIFEIRCFSEAQGCVMHGPSSSEFTWFQGYSWQIALCGSCSMHLGWHFSSGELGFFGLIEKNLSTT